jgi:hypothetical protein
MINDYYIVNDLGTCLRLINDDKRKYVLLIRMLHIVFTIRKIVLNKNKQEI